MKKNGAARGGLVDTRRKGERRRQPPGVWPPQSEEQGKGEEAQPGSAQSRPRAGKRGRSADTSEGGHQNEL